MSLADDHSNDAVNIAPDIHQVLFEDDKLRVLRVSVAPGAKVAMHWHPRNINYVLSSGELHFTKPDGTVSEVELTTGQVVSGGEGLHAVENVGTTTLQTIQIELKT